MITIKLSYFSKFYKNTWPNSILLGLPQAWVMRGQDAWILLVCLWWWGSQRGQERSWRGKHKRIDNKLITSPCQQRSNHRTNSPLCKYCQIYFLSFGEGSIFSVYDKCFSKFWMLTFLTGTFVTLWTRMQKKQEKQILFIAPKITFWPHK